MIRNKLYLEFNKDDFDACFFNASGVNCTDSDELNTLLKSKKCCGCVTKSITLNKREGNVKPRYKPVKLGSINSMGLPNNGLKYYIKWYSELSLVDQKRCVFSLCGLTHDNTLFMLHELNTLMTSYDHNLMVEVNLSCPNIIDKPQTGYDFDTVEDILNKIKYLYLKNLELGFKLPPYFDIAHFKKMSEILLKYSDIVNYVVCCNSIGNGLIIDYKTEKVLIAPKKGFGGIGGDYIKPTALANVRAFYNLIGHKINIIGCGGIKSGVDAFEYILCGAHSLRIGTQLKKEGTNVFNRISTELRSIMDEKGYEKISDFRGKLLEY